MNKINYLVLVLQLFLMLSSQSLVGHNHTYIMVSNKLYVLKYCSSFMKSLTFLINPEYLLCKYSIRRSVIKGTKGKNG